MELSQGSKALQSRAQVSMGHRRAGEPGLPLFSQTAQAPGPRAGLWGTFARWGGEISQSRKEQIGMVSGSGWPVTSSLCKVPGPTAQMKATDP